jgi:hypothetical protein
VPLVVNTRLEFNLFPEEAEIVMRDHLSVGSKNDLEITCSEFPFKMVSLFGSFTLSSVVWLDVDVWGEFTEVSDPVF